MVSQYSMRGFYLAVATTVTLGLGMGRALPVMALANAHTDELPAVEVKQPTQQKAARQQPSTHKAHPSFMAALAAALSPGKLQVQANAPGEATSEEDGDDGIGKIFVIIGLLAFLIGLIASLSSSDDAADSQDDSARPPQPVAVGNNGNAIRSIQPVASGGQTWGNNQTPAMDPHWGEKPQAVPTPALLPGLLAMGLKALQQKKRSLDQA